MLLSNLQTRLLSEDARLAVARAAEEQNAFDLPFGTRLHDGGYVVEEVLGRGGFGITYRARDCQTERIVAIKEFFPTGCARIDNRVEPRGTTRDGSAIEEAGFAATRFADGKRQFLEEARVLIGLRHPNIVRVQSAFQENASAYIVMEHLEGQTLLERVEESGPLPPDEALEIIHKIGGALEAVHHLGMLHLDIKPENVFQCDLKQAIAIEHSRDPFVATAPETGDNTTKNVDTTQNVDKKNPSRRIVLMDFDLMRRIEGATTYQTRPLSHTSHCGTPGYAPLEQYTQGTRFGTHTDIYALGATLYHLLTGHAPPSAPDRAHRQMTGASEVLVNSRHPSQLRDAVAWAMQIRPERRPQTTRDFLNALSDTSKASDAPHMSTHAAAIPSPHAPQAHPSAVSVGPLPTTSRARSYAVHSAQGAPGSVPHTSVPNGEWHQVKLAKNAEVEWPLTCACCGGAPEGFLSLEASQPKNKSHRARAKSGQRWQVPYCLLCLRHVKAASHAVSGAIGGMSCGLSLAAIGVATSNLYVGPLGVFVHFTAMAYWVLKYVFAEQTATPRCGDTRQAINCTASNHGIVWKFRNPDYAAAFRLLNAAAMV